MEVVAYVNNSDLLVEDETGCAVIGGSHYVLSIGDRIYIQHPIDTDAKLYAVKISFASAEHIMLHEDEIQIKYEGSKAAVQAYLRQMTVH